MSDPVSENGTPWNQLPGATGGVRRHLTSPPANPMEQLQKAFLGPFAHLAAALTGGDPDDWDTIEEIIDNIVGALDIGDLVDGLGDLLQGVIPVGWLSATTPNMLANGGFDGVVSMVEGEGWSWDETTGRTSPGAACFSASGVRGVQQSTPVQVAEGQKLAAEVWAKWAGVTASGDSLRVVVRWWEGDALVAETVVDSTDSPAVSGGWSKLSGKVTTPAGVSTATVALIVEETVSAGSVWWDDAALSKPSTSIPQQWVDGLLDKFDEIGDDIAGAFEWIRSLIEKLTGRVRTSIEDAIGDAVDFADQLKTILSGGSVAAPIPTLAGALIGTMNTVQNQITEILNGNVVTPVNSLVAGVKDWFAQWFGGGSSNAIPLSQKGASNGVAPLNSSSKLSTSYLVTDTASNVPTLDGSAKIKAAQIPDLSANYLPVGARGAVSGVAPLNASSVVPLANLPAEVGGTGGDGAGLPYIKLGLASQTIPRAVTSAPTTLRGWAQSGGTASVAFTDATNAAWAFPLAGVWLMELIIPWDQQNTSGIRRAEIQRQRYRTTTGGRDLFGTELFAQVASANSYDRAYSTSSGYVISRIIASQSVTDQFVEVGGTTYTLQLADDPYQVTVYHSVANADFTVSDVTLTCVYLGAA